MYIDASIKQIEIFEGRVSHMYLDTKGNVTVGVGKLLHAVQDAQELPFQIDTFGTPLKATADDIAQDFSRVQRSTKGFIPAYYRWPGSLFLADEVIDNLLRRVVLDADYLLTKRFMHYTVWPDPAKLAFLDMAYNLGTLRLFTEYTHLMAAAGVESWIMCAEECARNADEKPFEARNEWTRQQFLTAATIAPQQKEAAPVLQSNVA